MRAPALLPFATLVLLSAATSVRGQVVRGRVIDNATGEGVPTAVVEALAAGRSAGRTRTAVDGKFEVRLRAAGTFRFTAQRTGYDGTVTSDVPVAPRETVYVELRMATAPTRLDPLLVTARVNPPHRRSLEMVGFYDRERWGIGRFIRREDFENRASLSTATILAREPGTVLRGSGPHGYIVFSRSATANGYCLPLLFLDGVRISSSAALSDVVGPNQVEAVELYRSAAEIPVQYNSSEAGCGVILIWTRHER